MKGSNSPFFAYDKTKYNRSASWKVQYSLTNPCVAFDSKFSASFSRLIYSPFFSRMMWRFSHTLTETKKKDYILPMSLHVPLKIATGLSSILHTCLRLGIHTCIFFASVYIFGQENCTEAAISDHFPKYVVFSCSLSRLVELTVDGNIRRSRSGHSHGWRRLHFSWRLDSSLWCCNWSSAGLWGRFPACLKQKRSLLVSLFHNW